MRKKTALFIGLGFLLVTVGLSGCKKKDDDDRILADPSSAQSVTDFSSFHETDVAPIEVETEPQTVKETQPPTEKPTEKPTETERETQPETDPPETAHSEDYDFSEIALYGAVFAEYGGIGFVPYHNTARYSPADSSYVQTVEWGEGHQLIFTAWPDSGRTNQKVELYYPASETGAFKNVLLMFNNGLNTKNINDFFQGKYNGEENAPLLGLKDACFEIRDNTYLYASFTKNPFPNGETHGFAVDAVSLSEEIGSDKTQIILSKDMENDPIRSILLGMEFDTVEKETFDIGGYTVITDEKGEVIESHADFSATYKTATSRYELSLTGEGLKITVTRNDCEDSVSRMRFANYLYQNFYAGELDLSYDLSNGVYQKDNCTVTGINSGFEMLLKK